MFAIRPVALAFVVLFGITGCGSDEKAATIVMPDVTGKKLDVALSGIKSAGVEDDVDVDGGGTFGVVDESNWTVCGQTPAAGQQVKGAPRLSVDRSCDVDDAAAPTTQAAATTGAPEVSEPAPEKETLTGGNNADLAALLVGTDCGEDTVGAFASKYRGQTIEFDGNIGAMNKHDDYDTRYDFLVLSGDFSETTSNGGPNFQFRDVGILDLHLTGSNVPDSIGAGTNLHVVAKVGEYIDRQCLLLLDPVLTAIR